MVHARVLLRLRGREERDHHKEGSKQHRAAPRRRCGNFYLRRERLQTDFSEDNHLIFDRALQFATEPQKNLNI